MSRSKHELVLRARFRDEKGTRSSLVFKRGDRSLDFSGKKVLRLNKVSQNELYHIAEFNPLPGKLMREFTEQRKLQGLKEVIVNG